jgi:phenylalanyl-tRNA synthetase beta chain
VKGPLVAFEITLDVLPPPKYRPTKIKPRLVLSELQAVTRDFAFVVERDVAAADILKAAQATDRQLITSVDVFDVYEGTGIAAGKKSVAVAVTLQPSSKTLTDSEIEAISARIVAEVAKKTGAILRS